MLVELSSLSTARCTHSSCQTSLHVYVLQSVGGAVDAALSAAVVFVVVAVFVAAEKQVSETQKSRYLR